MASLKVWEDWSYFCLTTDTLEVRVQTTLLSPRRIQSSIEIINELLWFLYSPEDLIEWSSWFLCVNKCPLTFSHNLVNQRVNYNFAQKLEWFSKWWPIQLDYWHKMDIGHYRECRGGMSGSGDHTAAAVGGRMRFDLWPSGWAGVLTFLLHTEGKVMKWSSSQWPVAQITLGVWDFFFSSGKWN